MAFIWNGFELIRTSIFLVYFLFLQLLLLLAVLAQKIPLQYIGRSSFTVRISEFTLTVRHCSRFQEKFYILGTYVNLPFICSLTIDHEFTYQRTFVNSWPHQ